MGRGDQEGFVFWSFPQVDNNLRKALKHGVAEEKENTLFAHTYRLKFWGKLYRDFFCQKLLSEFLVIISIKLRVFSICPIGNYRYASQST